MEIKFKRDTSFRKQFFVPDSFAHPAKMDAQLLIWIVENYTKKWETILDPMAGSGTTMLACGLSRNVILVELEEKFCKMMRDNWAKVRMWPQLGHRMGTCDIIQGDARNLETAIAGSFSGRTTDFDSVNDGSTPSPATNAEYSNGRKPVSEIGGEGSSPSSATIQLEGLLVDKCIFSPPYAEAQSGGGIAQKGYQGDKHSPTDLVGKRSYMPENVGTNPNQISNLPYGSIDKIVTSPPYAEGKSFHDLEFMDKTSEDQRKRTESGKIKGHSFTTEARRRVFEKAKQGEVNNPSNLANLPYGNIDAVISSPPYEEAMGKKHHSPRADKLAQEKRNPTTYTGVDAVVTSPPFSRATENRGQYHQTEGLKDMVSKKSLAINGYSDNPTNIGNLKSTSYLDAMLQVYDQCWGVLKDGGLLILVTKNFIRNKQIVRLDTDTIKLCEQAGFSYLERHYRKLPSQSFWRVIYHQKHPEVEQINYEDVLIFQKQMELKE